MKHTASRDLYAYWNALRGTHPAPERSDIDPGAIRGALGDTFILAHERGQDDAFRLAGTRVCALFCRELKNTMFQQLFHERSRAEINQLIDLASEDFIGIVAGLSAELADGSAVALELLMLPLLQRGVTDRRLIGVLAPASSPAWLGIHPVQSLTLTSWRHVGPQLDELLISKFFDLPENAAPEMLPAATAATRNRTFVVLNGGRA